MADEVVHSDDEKASARLQDLIKLREALKTWMVEAPLDRKAALVAQFRATLAEIDELAPPEKKQEGFDEVKARRDARRAGSTKNKGRSTG